jgi:hypothetical protein
VALALVELLYRLERSWRTVALPDEVDGRGQASPEGSMVEADVLAVVLALLGHAKPGVDAEHQADA